MEINPIILKFVYAAVVVGVVMGLCSYAVLAERKVCSWIQGRVGPNRTTLPLIGSIPVIGKFLTRLGIFQPVADGAKFLFKEDVTPAHVNKFYFIMAPVLSLVPALTTVVVVPFGRYVTEAGEIIPLVLADLDVGLLFLFAISSLGVYGVVLAGWSSNSKFSFLGGIRASAQMISYELAMGISVLPVLMWVNAPGTDGTLSLFDIGQAQEGLWFVMWMPLSFLIFLVCLFAETNRLPFDMAESETELVSGFHTEYSSFKFGLFFVGEYAHMIVGSCVITVLFLGGWNPAPFLTWDYLGFGDGILGAVLSVGTFMGKMCASLFLFIWVRWTLPRFRYDQVMRLGWQYLLPLSIANLIVYIFVIYFLDTTSF
ncbi:NADH-quinone oxidoreductase subunit NuoH [Puniceicoccaceae bacterium K14]|nr:NADH-quinone oxidoreductase subunit NuoH [Puniceicoccaceae bacterium K14]